MPQFSELIEQEDKKKEVDFYLNASKWTILVILPISSIILLSISYEFSGYWFQYYHWRSKKITSTQLD